MAASPGYFLSVAIAHIIVTAGAIPNDVQTRLDSGQQRLRQPLGDDAPHRTHAGDGDGER